MTEPLIPTQVAHPLRAALRTAIQAAPGVVAAVPLIVVAIEGDHPGLTGVIGAGAVAISAGVARVMAVPAVNGWLTKINLGATGKHSA